MIEVQDLTLTHKEELTLHLPEQPWSDKFALKVAVADFLTAEQFRTQNHDPRWALADQLYIGYEKQRYWKGTKIPRASLGQFVVFQQVESLMPKIMSAIFGDQPWFETGPQPGTTAAQALTVRDLLLWQMEAARQFDNQSIREVIRRAVKSGFLYGAGILELAWIDRTKNVRRMGRAEVNETRFDPLYGVEMPTGRRMMVPTEEMQKKRYQLPVLRNVSVKDLFIDPNCAGPQVQLSRYAVKRVYMTADELEKLRDSEDFSIPPRGELIAGSTHKPQSQSDLSKQWAEASRNVQWQPSLETSLDPGAGRWEVLVYETAERVVWVGNRGHVFYNQPNTCGFIKFFNSFYVDVPDRFYGMSLADVTEGEHRLQQAITNLRLDELSLYIHGETIKRSGIPIPKSQLTRHPGQVTETDNPSEDIKWREMKPMLQQAFLEVDYSSARTQKTTGLTDLVAFGTGTEGGNSANRTATGIGAQVQAGSSRIVYNVENTEDTFLEPALAAMHALNTLYLDPMELLKITGDRTIDPLDVLNADVQFTMRASRKMQSRMALMQVFGPLLQAFMNPSLMEQMARQGVTFDFKELLTVFLDATGYAQRGDLIRPLTPEEQERLAQPRPEENMKLQMQRERMKDIEKLQDKQNEDDLTREILSTGLEAMLTPEPKEPARADR